ncbi:hypothetical protein [Polaromonas sp. JS666]|uniref:hypothetical protein n=1 Tax=Polaromonas sp. (strain JS666 / ATCC BAA-500) TaxID=296591 RepID=UPI00004640B3|nr:hypothetical protein [Polaromonas sp. JS666]ABE43047.1 conserved hypothetical protein [Polaromonas sp. JS666]
MRSEVRVTFKNSPPVRVDLQEVQPMPHEAARQWLDNQFTQMGCEPLRPTGKLLLADKVVVVAQAGGPAKFADPQWALEFARAASASLAKPVVHIDVAALSITY